MRDMNRRAFLGMSAAGLIGASWSSTAFAREVWSTGTEQPAFRLPAGTIDCHMHIYDDRFPSAAGTTLRPPNASIEQYRAVQKRLGMHRNMVVTPSTYGTDNRCMLDALRRFGNDARGVAVVDTSITQAQLADMHGAGVRAIRFNLSYPDMLVPLASRIAPLRWHIKLVVQGAKLPSLETALAGLPCPLVIDHIAYVPQAGWTLLRCDARRAQARGSRQYTTIHRLRCPVRMSIRKAARQRMLMSCRWRGPSSKWRPSACSGARTGHIRRRSRRSPTMRISSM